MRLLSASLTAVLVSMVAASALPTTLEARTTGADCEQYEKYIGIYDNTLCIVKRTAACLKENGTSIWSHQACVAAATCQGASSVIILNQCQNPKVLSTTAIPNLAFTIYTNIVGDCADSGCPMTQQNYIDFIYGAMSAADVTVWPNNVDYVIDNWWTPMLTWAATGDSIPYTNFNDWLHYSNS